MKKTGICPKCNHDKIIIIKDQLHENGGGNISQITNHINKPSQVFAIFKREIPQRRLSIFVRIVVILKNT